MNEETRTKKLKKDIQVKQEILNNIIGKNKDKEQILKFSQELDTLICEYYLLVE